MDALQIACDAALANKDFRPNYTKDGKLVATHCNQAARAIAQALGCAELDDSKMTADLMIAHMEANVSKKWTKVDVSTAAIRALDGKLVFAGMTGAGLGEAHGHIAAVYPLARQPSASAGMDVPMLANIGSQNWKDGKPNPPIRTSEAFPVKRCGMPTFYAWA